MRQKSSDEQLGIDAKAVTDLIARNARVAQNQKEYNERYDALVSRYEDTERKRDAVVEQIDQIMIRRRKIERFIESVKGLPELITEFDESLWAGLVDSMTVHSKDRIVFHLTRGMETGGIEACAKIIAPIFGSIAEKAKDLAYRLYTIAERKGWAQEAYAYNSLVVSWPDIQSRAAQMKAVQAEQISLF